MLISFAIFARKGEEMGEPVPTKGPKEWVSVTSHSTEGRVYGVPCGAL